MAEEFKITRDNVAETYKKVTKRIEVLEGKEYEYEIGDLPRSVNGCVHMHSFIHSMADAAMDSAKALGVEDKYAGRKYNGYDVKTWDENLKRRVGQIADAEEHADLCEVEKTLRDRLSDDDLFELEMSGVAEKCKNI